MEELKDDIGQRLKKIRKERNVSAIELSSILGIPKERIYKWEQGASPKFHDRQIIEKWMDQNWKEVPHETPGKPAPESVFNEDQPEYNTMEHQNKHLVQAIINISQSNLNISESNKTISQSNQELVSMLKEQQQNYSDNKRINEHTALMVDSIAQTVSSLLSELTHEPAIEIYNKIYNTAKQVKKGDKKGNPA